MIINSTCGHKVYRIDSPCKINLHLQIGDKRPDGYHELMSIFSSLAFGDTLFFREGDRGGDCNIEMTGLQIPKIPKEENLVYKAVSLFREETGFEGGLEIKLEKQVPAGAGLGGGSSNAASTLIALDYIAKTRLSKEKMAALALKLGSDVPFFLNGGTALIRGRGEEITPLQTPAGLWVLLVKPPFHSDTSSAFRVLDKYREGKSPDSNPRPRDSEFPGDISLALSREPSTWPFFNDFLPVFLAERGQAYKEILAELRALNASYSGLSGAGSCCFGIFDSEKTAKIAEKTQLRKGNFIRLTFFVAHRAKPVVEY